MSGIVSRIETEIIPGTIIPKPGTDREYRVKGWGRRRGERALMYWIPNLNNPARPYQKGVTVSEWEQAFEHLMSAEEFRRSWFDTAMVGCSTEGGCNFTTIGGIFMLLGLAACHETGVYRKA